MSIVASTGPWNNPAIVWGKLGHLGLSISMSVIPTGCQDSELLEWNEGNTVMSYAGTGVQLIGSEEHSGGSSASGC